MAEEKILHRIIRATDEGWQYESDQRHVEIMIEEMGLPTATPLETAGADEKKDNGKAESDDDDASPELGAQAASQFRGLAARANYVSQDCADMQYAMKELCRCMSKPTEASWAKLKRSVRYLCGRPRAVAIFHWQEQSGAIDLYSDAI